MPPSNSYRQLEQLSEPEAKYPLRVLVCEHCWLVQTEDFASREELFEPNYAYFSSYSTSWLAHCKNYVAQVVERFGLGSTSFVVELASNDGYLLQFVKEIGIPCLGIEPTRAPAEVAVAKGVPVLQEFFGVELGRKLAEQGQSADLLIANNVLAHVPDINDFVAGIAALLKPDGVATFEFPHLLELCKNCQFDTIYHEHFSYLSLLSVERILAYWGLFVFDVESLATHGGSLRVFAQKASTGVQSRSKRVGQMLSLERLEGLCTAAFYRGFQARAERIRADFRRFVFHATESDETLGAYGAAAKGNTLLNYSGVTAEQIPFVVDLNQNKQGKCLPGSRILIVSEQYLKDAKPHYIIILPWNLRSEIVEQLHYVRDWGGQFVVGIPQLEVF